MIALYKTIYNVVQLHVAVFGGDMVYEGGYIELSLIKRRFHWRLWNYTTSVTRSYKC